MKLHRQFGRIVNGFGLKFTCVAALTIYLFAVAPAYGASFRVSPTRFEFSLDKRFTNFFTVINLSKDSLRMRVYASFIEVTDDNQIVEKKGHPYDLAPWIVINPRQITLRSRQKRTIRFSVRSPKELQDGEYRGVIFFEELPARIPVGAEKQKPKELRLQLQLKTRIGATLYGMKGEPQSQLTVVESRASRTPKGLLISSFIENNGNVHVLLKLSAKLVNEAGTEYEIPESVVVIQRGERRRWEPNVGRPTGNKFRLIVVGTSKKEEVLNIDIPIEVGLR
jgi:P pilus assembly chaperone PapD